MPRSADCQAVFAALSEVLDAELEGGDCAALLEHLRDCPECLEFLDSLRQTVALCREHPLAAAPPLSEPAKTELLAAYRRSTEISGSPPSLPAPEPPPSVSG